MPINETQLNGRIATLLDRMNVRWDVHAEMKGAFVSGQGQPDILVLPKGGRPVVIENEYLPARTLEDEAIARLGEKLDEDVTGVDGEVNAVVALKSPRDLRQVRGFDRLDEELRSKTRFQYCVYNGSRTPQDLGRNSRVSRRPAPLDSGFRRNDGGLQWSRFPESGFVSGNVRDLAGFITYASTPEDVVRESVEILERAISSTAAIIRESTGAHPNLKQDFADLLKQEYSEQTERMAATIMINALLFHMNLVGGPRLRRFEELRPDGKLLQRLVVQEWRKILKINYWSIFNIAIELLKTIQPNTLASRALDRMADAAERINVLGAADSSDLIGTVFQRLIADRKFLATFYTRPESATLLAHLAIPDGGAWADPERVKDFKIADYACGTGTLIHAAYRRLNQLHLFSGGDPSKLHSHMMGKSLTALDVLPSAVHLTASMLSSSHPTERYQSTRTIVTQYGKTENGGVSIGSLDLLASNGEVRPLISLHSGTAVTGTGSAQAADAVDMPQFSQDLVIMNPPFTRSGSDWDGRRGQTYQTKQFHGLRIDRGTQSKMSKLASEYGKGTCAHGYAGIASWFVALADRMVKHDGKIALVLPMTALQGSSWRKVRQTLASHYDDVIVLTIAAARQDDQSFSADTGMAETLIVGRRTSKGNTCRGTFVSLKQRPNNEMESVVIARAISEIASNGCVRRLEDGPYGGETLEVGKQHLGEIIEAPLDSDLPWSAVGISDFSVVQSARELSNGLIWLPRMTKKDALVVPITSVGEIAQTGMSDKDIVGSGERTAFDRHRTISSAPTYPMLWSHDAERETRMVVEPDSEGRVKRGRGNRAAAIWETRSHAHHNRDFRFNSQPLAVAFTENQAIGGRSWPSVKFNSRDQEIAYTLWGNSTLGLLLYWWHSSRQQAGRGSMPITAIRTMPTLDVTALSDAQLKLAEEIFEDMRDHEFLPANEAWRDESRKELDRLVLVDLLGLDEDKVLGPLGLLRRKWCSEPSVHGGKGTRP